MSDIVKAIIMGIIQGVTEFLPVSSSGHLAIFGQLLNIELDDGILFEILLHFGTLMAIVVVFFKDIKALIIDGLCIVKDFFVFLFKGQLFKEKLINTDNKRFVMLIIVATIPTGIIGFLMEAMVVDAFKTLLIPGIGLLITSLLLVISRRFHGGDKNAGRTSYLSGALIGLAQGLATFPGISRSGSTLVASLGLKLEKEFAIKFSFIMSIPAILGATIIKVSDAMKAPIESTVLLGYGLGTLMSFIVGYVAIKTLLVVVRRNQLHWFAYYTCGLGILAIIGHFML